MQSTSFCGRHFWPEDFMPLPKDDIARMKLKPVYFKISQSWTWPFSICMYMDCVSPLRLTANALPPVHSRWFIINILEQPKSVSCKLYGTVWNGHICVQCRSDATWYVSSWPIRWCCFLNLNSFTFHAKFSIFYFYVLLFFIWVYFTSFFSCTFIFLSGALDLLSPLSLFSFLSASSLFLNSHFSLPNKCKEVYAVVHDDIIVVPLITRNNVNIR